MTTTKGNTGRQRHWCGHCRKEIYKARNGEWYHVRNATTSCYFGTGSDKRAFPAGQPRQSSDTHREHD